ncbi:MAG: cell division protein FtsZ, partial [Betaproteobacteria bacterium]|nr:cell division protein FtsZ [Betaproteobacteria bacterium]
MSDLTIGLGILGGLVLAGVVAHSAWVSRRNTPRQAQPASEPHDAAPIEPGVAVEPGESHASADVMPAERSEPVLLGDDPLPTQDRRALIDPLIDSIASISLEGVISGDAVLAVMPLTRRAGSKPFLIEAQAEGSDAWEPPASGRRYVALQAGVQLANRTGALNEIEYSEFVMKTRTFADAIGGEPQFAEMLDEVARA